MNTKISINVISLAVSFLFLFSFAGCSQSDPDDIPSKETPSAIITPIIEAVEAAAVDNMDIKRLEDMEKLDQIISIEEVKLSDYYYELYRSSAEYFGLPEALDDKFNFTIRYSSGNCEVVGYISAPADYLEKSYPILIYNRGGNGNFGEVTPADLCLFAHMGYIAIATQYRGNDGGTGKDGYGGAEVQDVISLIDIAEQLPFANGKTYMIGLSRGGLETYCTLKEEYLAGRNRISAAVVGYGVSDLVKLYQVRDQGMKDTLVQYIGGTPDQVPEEYEKRSAVYWPELINSPILICHGRLDERAPVEQAETMYNLLKEQEKEAEILLYDAGHGFTPESFNYAFRWLSTY